MKKEQGLPNTEKRATHRMGGQFYVKPYEVHDTLIKLGTHNSFYDAIVRNAAIKEDWSIDGIWVIATFTASMREMGTWANKGKSYAATFLEELLEAKAVEKLEDGSYRVPRYKRKQDEGVKASDIQFLYEKIENLELIIRDLVANKNDKSPEEKEDEIKVLYSEDIISLFYKRIGQQRISGEKRAKARNVYRKLRDDNFTPEEICFAVQWTLDNANEKPYDFALIPSTIGQALAVKEKAERKKTAEEERQEEADREREKLERQEKERDDWEFYKAELPEEEREELKQRAIQEISDSGEFPAQFITDVLIVIRENEILRKEGKGQ